MKYLIKNKRTGEETLCEKVVVYNYDYYISGSDIAFGDYWAYIGFNEGIEITKYNFDEDSFNKLWDKNNYKKVIATTNKSFDLPQVVDELNISQYSKEDMIEFSNFKDKYWSSLSISNFMDKTSTDEELLDIWQEQKIKTIIVE